MGTIKETQIIHNTNNYSVWKFKIEMLFIEEELFELVTDESPTPITTEWQIKDRKACAIINLSTEDATIIHVKKLNTANETWDALKTIMKGQTFQKLYLLPKLYGAKSSENGNM